MPNVLVVDDDVTVRRVVKDYLAASGFEVCEAGDGHTALSQVEKRGPDLVVLDLMLPELDGLEVLRRLRTTHQELPIVMLTARGDQSDRILGLELGADDYLTKPFSPRELVLRVQAVLRRGVQEHPGDRPGQRQTVEDGDLLLDLTARRAVLAGRELTLTLREYDLLAQLAGHPDEVFSRDRLMAEVWGWEHGDQSTVTVHVRRLRGKIEADPARPTRLVTVWGRGYRWEPTGRDAR